MKKVCNDSYQNMAIDATMQAGEITKEYLQKDIKVWHKSKNQPVTEADIKVNKFLQKEFKERTPQFGWLSEESEDNRSRFKFDYFWCVDPIDGTRSFINKKAEYAISVALIKNNFPIFGIIYNPITKEMFTAEKENGAFCNSTRIFVNKKNRLQDCKLAISNSERGRIKENNFFNKLDVLKMGSIAYKIALVAKGTIDIALTFTNKNDWDLAAAYILIKEAGGNISLINGSEIKFNTKNLKIPNVSVSNTIIHKQLIENIESQ